MMTTNIIARSATEVEWWICHCGNTPRVCLIITLPTCEHAEMMQAISRMFRAEKEDTGQTNSATGRHPDGAEHGG